MFTKIKVLSTPELVVSKIKQEIINGKYPGGTRLPSERDLAVQFGIGRSTVREAIQILRIMGVIEVKCGNKGGTFVKKNNSDNLSEMIELMIQLEVSSWKDVIETRKAIEPFLCMLAAKNRTAEDLDEIRNLLIESKQCIHETERYINLNTLFHLKIIESSYNKILTSLYRAISFIISKNGYDLMKKIRLRELVYDDHMQIFIAIEEQNSELAYSLAEKHILNAESVYLGIISG